MAASNRDDALWALVSRSSKGVLATVGADGMPHLTSMHYLADPVERIVRLTTTTDRVKGRNLMRDPRASLHVQGDDWFQFATIAGAVTVGVAEEEGDPVTDELHELISTLRGPAARPEFDREMLDHRRMIARISVDRIYGLTRQD